MNLRCTNYLYNTALATLAYHPYADPVGGCLNAGTHAMGHFAHRNALRDSKYP